MTLRSNSLFDTDAQRRPPPSTAPFPIASQFGVRTHGA